jgi:hypothetical protein
MDSNIATDTDTSNLETAPVTPDSTQPGSDNAVVGTVEVTPSGEAESSSTSQTSSTPTESAEDRLTKQLEARFSNPATAATPAAAQTTTAQPQALTLQAVQEALGLKSFDDLKRIQNLSTLHGRQTNELGQARKQLQELTQAQQAAQQRQEQEAARQNLSPFHKQNPQYQGNRERIIRANAFLAASQGKTDPNEVRALAAQMRVNSQDVDLAHQEREYRENLAAEQAADPEGFVESRAVRVVKQEIQNLLQYLDSRDQAKNFVAQNQELINDPIAQQLMDKALDPSTSRSDLAIQIARLTKERDELLTKAHQTTGETERLKAQQELSGRQTFTTRRASTSTTTHVDPWKSYDPKDPKAQDKLLEKLFQR